MSLIACKDKKRRKRVVASDKLPRKDYYCPNEKCNAILRLIDCNDETRSDHFRVKQNYPHIPNCPYNSETEYLNINKLTNSEILILSDTLNKTKTNLLNLANLLNKACNKTIKNNHTIIYNSFSEWLDYDISQKHTLNYISNKIQQLSNYIDTFDIKKFKFYTKHRNNVVASCLPFTFCKISLSNSFFEQTSSIYKQGVIIHEATHQLFWTNDFGGYGKNTKQKKSKTKQWNAENWENCFVDIFTHWNPTNE